MGGGRLTLARFVSQRRGDADCGDEGGRDLQKVAKAAKGVRRDRLMFTSGGEVTRRGDMTMPLSSVIRLRDSASTRSPVGLRRCAAAFQKEAGAGLDGVGAIEQPA